MGLANVLEEAVADKSSLLDESEKKPTAYAFGAKGKLVFYDWKSHKVVKGFSGYFVNFNRITKGKPTLMLAKRKGNKLELIVVRPWESETVVESLLVDGCDDLFSEVISEDDLGGQEELSEAVGREHILKKLQGSEWEALTDVARGFLGHFKKLESATKVLEKQGKIETKMDSRLGLMLRLKK